MTIQARTAEWVSRHTTLIILIGPLLLVSLLTQAIGDRLLERIVITMFINLILVLGLQIFMGNSGILSFAHIGFMGIGAYTSVLFSMTPQAKAIGLPDLYPFLVPIHVPFLAAILIGAVVACLVAAVVSFPLMRLSDAAAVITTFALLVIIHVVLVHWDNLTNGPQTLFGVSRYTYLWNTTAWAILFVIAAYLFKESSLGLRLRASRDDEYAAATSGINMVMVRWAGFVLSAFVAGLGGGLWAHFITSFSPKAFYLTETFVILAMLVIGGPRGVSGAVLGTLVVTAVREILRAIENSVNIAGMFETTVVGFAEVVLAATLIVILILRPSGILGGRELRWPNKRSKVAAAEDSYPRSVGAKGA